MKHTFSASALDYLPRVFVADVRDDEKVDRPWDRLAHGRKYRISIKNWFTGDRLGVGKWSFVHWKFSIDLRKKSENISYGNILYHHFSGELLILQVLLSMIRNRCWVVQKNNKSKVGAIIWRNVIISLVVYSHSLHCKPFREVLFPK